MKHLYRVCNDEQLKDHVLCIITPDRFVSSWKLPFCYK